MNWILLANVNIMNVIQKGGTLSLSRIFELHNEECSSPMVYHFVGANVRTLTTQSPFTQLTGCPKTFCKFTSNHIVVKRRRFSNLHTNNVECHTQIGCFVFLLEFCAIWCGSWYFCDVISFEMSFILEAQKEFHWNITWCHYYYYFHSAMTARLAEGEQINHEWCALYRLHANCISTAHCSWLPAILFAINLNRLCV